MGPPFANRTQPHGRASTVPSRVAPPPGDPGRARLCRGILPLRRRLPALHHHRRHLRWWVVVFRVAGAQLPDHGVFVGLLPARGCWAAGGEGANRVSYLSLRARAGRPLIFFSPFFDFYRDYSNHNPAATALEPHLLRDRCEVACRCLYPL
jgi:hypothetical protein